MLPARRRPVVFGCAPTSSSVEEDERLLREWYGEGLARPSDEGPEGLCRVGMDVREVGEVG